MAFQDENYKDGYPWRIPAREGSGGFDDEEYGYWEGTVFSVKKVAEGEGTYGPWELYIVTGMNGDEFSTFDQGHVDIARNAGLDPVLIDWEINKKGYRNITLIQLAKESEFDIPC